MKLTVDYLQEALEMLGDMPDAKKAEALKISKQALSGYKSGRNVMDDYACIMVANKLNLDPLEIIAAANMEREKSFEKKEFWADFRKKIGALAVAGLMVLTTLMSPVEGSKAPSGV
ncbi:hypothetical protein [Vogesella sp. XCS3]|uniref:hypothetical protein n=1 Tax=Vogesella sp. XCS3 TaxID=2877939 RepID=UPI001D0A6417|nr:hypothetical protein [Vogesella sp. XCS3]UDM17784.1 hypothetical protein LCH97_03735 [Vogesella sp. XCS3]